MPLLNACAKFNDVETGCKLHATIASKGLERDPFIGSSLVSMYAKCGLLEKAQEVFEKLQAPDVVAWTALIAGYTKHGRGEEALSHFQHMLLEGVSPSIIAFSCCLRACGSIRATLKGQEIHAEIARRGLLSQDFVVGNALVDMYAKCGLLENAREAFNELQNRNVISWTAIIAAHVKHGQDEEALRYFEEMQLVGICPDVVTFVCGVKACSNLRAPEKGLGLHFEIARHVQLEGNRVLANALLDMYANCRLLVNAHDVFDKVLVKDVVSWTTLIGGYAEHGHGEYALDLLKQMQRNGVRPNAVTFICSLKACTNIGAVDEGLGIHEEIVKQGFLNKDRTLGNTLIDMYANCGWLAKAEEVFNELPARNAVSWTAMITGYIKHGYGEEALNFFEQMQRKNITPDAVAYVCALKACGSIKAADTGAKLHGEVWKNRMLRNNLLVGNTLVDMYAKCGLLSKAQKVFDNLPVRDTVSWNALLAGYANHEQGEEALKLFKQMKVEKVPLDEVTLVCVLKACGSIGAADTGSNVYAKMSQEAFFEDERLLLNAMVDMYANCGLLAKAEDVFDKLRNRDVISWTSVIAGYAQLGESHKAFSIFDQMREECQVPNFVTFQSLLNACSHEGLVSESGMCLKAMSIDHGITPTLGHCTCIIDLLGRAGQLEKATRTTRQMPFHPNLVVWHTIMGACRRSGHVELGRQAFEHAIVLDKEEASTYISIANVFVDADIVVDINEEV